ncbi:phage integrase N-terminal SAM-like domain-containing protein [Lysinibacillus sp. FSL H8-0500]|uniref:site-specific integrase n=1 Tax=Lysinibacillus sp. FSL H8-0500 TaxID=2921393 RepID=UPI003100D36B
MILFADTLQQFLQHLSFRQYSLETLRGYQIDLTQLANFLTQSFNGPIMLDEITTDHLEAFQQMLILNYQSIATINQKTHSMKSLFK